MSLISVHFNFQAWKVWQGEIVFWVFLGLWSGGCAGRRRCNERMLWSVRDVSLGLGLVDRGSGEGSQCQELRWAVHDCTSGRIILEKIK